MDLYNNSVGYWIGQQVRDEGGVEQDVYDRVEEIANLGALETIQ